MFEVIKNQMIAKWLEYETTDVHPMLNNAECLTDLFDYYQEVLGGGFEEFLKDYGLSLVPQK